jgi:putative ABC transport system substrate-binding protein
MRRREFITLVSGSAAAWPFVARGQSKAYRIGFVGSIDRQMPERLEAFRAGLRDLGYQEGRNIVIEYRWAEGRYERLPALFAELVGLNVDVIVTHGTPGALAAKQVTNTIPIVVAIIADAEASGVAASLAEPGANLTGISYFTPELCAKRLELLKEIMPGLTDVGVLLNPANSANAPIVPTVRRTAELLKLKLNQFGAREPGEFEAAFAEMASKRIGALVVIDDANLVANAQPLAQLALRQRLPSSGWSDYAVAGGLLSYGINFTDMFRRTANFVDKILKGAKPSGLPIERATKFETIVNLRTAKALGIEVSTSLLLRADEIIE